jgi:hypothetical protein
VSPVREGESLLDGEELPRPGGSPRHGVTRACVGTSTMDEIVAFGGIKELLEVGMWSSSCIQAQPNANMS